MALRLSRAETGRWTGRVAPAAGGLLLALAFPPWGLWPLAFVAWVPLWLLLAHDAHRGRPLQARRAFLQGWLMGFAGFVVLLYWILGLSNEEVTIPGLMFPALALLALYVGLFFGLAALVLRWLVARTGSPLLLLAPVVTLVFEWLRSRGPLGFPWGAPAYAFSRATPLLQISAETGFWGLVLLVLAVNALLAAFVRGRRWALPAVLGLLALWWIQGESVLARHPEGTPAGGRRPLRVLVAQPDIRREIKWKRERREEVISLILSHGREAAARGADAGGFDLFVWPETVFPVLLFHEPGLLPRVMSFIDSIGTPVLLGTQEAAWEIVAGDMGWAIYNSAVLMHPGGALSPMYRKIKLVPFSERMPLQKIAPWLDKIDFGQSNFSSGDEGVLFCLGPERIGCLICFESVFPEVSQRLVRQGATVIVNITNDFWFGRTAGPTQHAEMAIFRAVENRVPLVRCANTGVSFVVDPWGRVREERPVFVQAEFVTAIDCGSGSFSARHPGWIVWPWLAWTTAAIGAGPWRSRRRRARAQRPAPSAPAPSSGGAAKGAQGGGRP